MRSSSITSGIGSAPERSATASVAASSGVSKPPSIWPLRPMALWMTGAVTTSPSMMAARRSPMFSRVNSRKMRVPSVSQVKVTMGRWRRS